MYGEGVSKMGELVDLGVKAGIVEKSGSWFSYDSERIGQGRENAKTYLREHPAMAAKIESAVRQSAGLDGGKILDEMAEDSAATSESEAASGLNEDVAPVAAIAGVGRRGKRGSSGLDG